MTTLPIPELSFVVLLGASGSGKSTFAVKHFKPTEVLSSDFCCGLVSDDENDHAATKEAFEILHFIAAKRLAAGRLTVVDATNVQPESLIHRVSARQFTGLAHQSKARLGQWENENSSQRKRQNGGTLTSPCGQHTRDQPDTAGDCLPDRTA